MVVCLLRIQTTCNWGSTQWQGDFWLRKSNVFATKFVLAVPTKHRQSVWPDQMTSRDKVNLT